MKKVALAAGSVGGAALVALVAFATLRGLRDAGEPSRCADGLVAIGPRCCGEGQRLEAGRCSGAPSRCGPLHAVTPIGCAPADPAARVTLARQHLRIGAGDWEAQGVVTPREADVPPFAIDAFEVTEARWADCARATTCAPREPATEPGLPVTAVTFDDAATFCRWAGGRLPTRDELAVAISRDGSRRYPWGDTGAVCRRGAWGLLTGPCATSGAGPDVVASHPDGSSREGVHDLAGNVAEWAVPPHADHHLADVLGGSWQDGEAAALRGWNHRSVAKTTRAPTIGFRCVYTSI